MVVYELEFKDPIGLQRFDGEFHSWGSPKLKGEMPVVGGNYRFHERPNPATGTSLQDGVTGPWLFLLGTPFGAAKNWLLKRALNVNVINEGDKVSTAIAEPEVTVTIKKPEKPPETEFKPQIEFTDLGRIDLRVGLVVTAVDHPKADKLLLLTVDFGEEKPRNVVAGIKGKRKPDDIIGQKYIFVVNLPPAKIRGEESSAMILAAKDDEDGFALATVDQLYVKVGSPLG
jgi:methionine--tRNA ligase beta chain